MALVPMLALAPMTAGAFTIAAPVAASSGPTCVARPAAGSFDLVMTESTSGDMAFVLIVACKPVYAGSLVTFSTPQLAAGCAELEWFSDSNGVAGTTSSYTVTLDADGNAFVKLWGTSCAARTYKVYAQLLSPPDTVVSYTLTVSPPKILPTGFVAHSRAFVMTTPLGSNDVARVLRVQYPAQFAGQNVKLTTFEPCTAYFWTGPDPDATPSSTTNTVTLTLDGNARLFAVFEARGCTAGTFTVLADLQVAPFTEQRTTVNDLSSTPINP
jgi:hypothetical protein